MGLGLEDPRGFEVIQGQMKQKKGKIERGGLRGTTHKGT